MISADAQRYIHRDRRGKCKVILGPAGHVLHARLAGNENASSRVARAFKDVKLNEKQPTESYWNVYVPDTSQGGSFRRYFSYFLSLVSWFHAFQNCMWHLWSAK